MGMTQQERLDRLFNELGADIRDADIIRWYGTGANYYFVSEGLCLPIIRTLLEKDIETEPAAVINRIEELMVKHSENGALSMMMDYAILVARFYETALGLGSLTLNTADEYVHRYQTDYYLTDQYYRQATELYFKIDPTSELFDSIQKVKLSLDQNYNSIGDGSRFRPHLECPRQCSRLGVKRQNLVAVQ